jgi:basic amino acid/polyamine antiporter, APA family
VDSESSVANRKTISPLTATCIVVANMIGTGIFTSLGFQIGDLPTGFSILAVWAVGGICALCGALSYAELGAALPRSGGEYNFLREIYHPAVGFMAGWISATVGFAAPVAIAAMAFSTYFSEVAAGVSLLLLALLVATVCTLALLRDLRLGSAFQNGSTILKVALILVVIGAGFFVTSSSTQPISFLPVKGDGALILSAPFAVSLYWVMYAYSGWNASTYIVSELRNPSRTIPISVGIGTAMVIVLYLLTNAVFLRTTPAPEMIGKQQVAVLAGQHIFGTAGTKVMATFICLGLISTISAMMWIGPRITAAMGEDLGLLAPLAHRNARGVPVRAILVQYSVVVLLLFTATFETAVNYIQFSLALCSTLTVLGVFVLRWRRPDLSRPYRVWGYPVTPAIFLVVSAWMLVHMLTETSSRMPALLGLATMLLGVAVYFLSAKKKMESV